MQLLTPQYIETVISKAKTRISQLSYEILYYEKLCDFSEVEKLTCLSAFLDAKLTALMEYATLTNVQIQALVQDLNNFGELWKINLSHDYTECTGSSSLLESIGVDHLVNVANVGVFTHVQIDSHINSTANPHSTTFLTLDDTPASYTSGSFVRVNALGNALEFGTGIGDAGSGLTLNSDAIDLGGPLTLDAVIDGGSSHAVLFDDLSSFQVLASDASDPLNYYGELNLVKGKLEMGLVNTSSSPLSSANIDIGLNGGPDNTVKVTAGNSSLEILDSGGLLTFTGVGSPAMEYAADYSANFTDRSLVDKGYVDSLVSTGVTASNGLTLAGSEIGLGGALTSSTVVDGVNSYGLAIQNLLGYTTEVEDVTSPNQKYTVIDQDATSAHLYVVNTLDAYDQAGFQIYKPVSINGHLSRLYTGSTQISLYSESAEVRVGGLSPAGLEYAADYSANYTDRSLVDKEYVDSLTVGANFPGLTGDVVAGSDGITTISDSVVTNAKLGDMAANTVKGRSASLGAAQDISIGTNQVLGRLSGDLTAISYNFLALPDTPSTYSVQNQYVVRVKNDTTGLEFVPPGDIFSVGNGLSKSFNEISLGGNLSTNTELEGAGSYELLLDNVSAFKAYSRTTVDDNSDMVHMIINPANGFIQATNTGGLAYVSVIPGIADPRLVLSAGCTLTLNNSNNSARFLSDTGFFLVGDVPTDNTSLGVNVSTVTMPNVTDSFGIEVAGGITATGEIYAGGNIISGSDIRIKKDIEPYLLGLDLIEKIDTYSFKLIDGDDSVSIGVVAQDLVELGAVGILYGSESTQYSVAYNKITIPLVNAVKELSEKVRELEAKISNLE